MRNRIEILKEIMEIEKKYAIEEIDSKTFETKIQELERELDHAPDPTNEELDQAIESKKIPHSAHRLVGLISIEELLPNYDLPRSFYRHLKIRWELKKLEKRIAELMKTRKKIKVLLAEKKIDKQSAELRLESLEFDLRFAENRFRAREKYLKRNPSKGDLLRFTLENYQKFSYGGEIQSEEDLEELIQDLEEELSLRKEYRESLAEFLASLKASQLEISQEKTEAGLPDFKKLREFQMTINEVYEYIKILNEDIKLYTKVLNQLKEDHLNIDEQINGDFLVADFGISIGEDMELERRDEEMIDETSSPIISPKIDDDLSYIIDSFDIAMEEDEIIPDSSEIQDSEEFEKELPETPYPIYKPRIDIEVEGMEDFENPFDIESAGDVNISTKKIIFQSFEDFLEQLINENGKIIIPPKPEQPRTTRNRELKAKAKQKPSSQPLKERVEFTTLTQDLEGVIETEQEEIKKIPIDQISPPEKISEKKDLSKRITKISTEVEKHLDKSTDKKIQTERKKPPKLQKKIPLPPPPPPEEEERVIDYPEGEHLMEAQVMQAPKIDRKLPTKQRMISEELVRAATKAWRYAGKALFTSEIINSQRKFIGYLQEVIIFDNNKLGFSIVSETEATQEIIDTIFNQIKPIWMSEELTKSAQKRRKFVIEETIQSLNVSKEIALHISTLKEFANFRNITFPTNNSLEPPKPIGILPLSDFRVKGGRPICQEEQVLSLRPYRTAPWQGKLPEEFDNPLKTTCVLNSGIKLGKIISKIDHPLMGSLLLIDTEVPDNSLVSYLEKRLEISEKDHNDRLWLIKYLIAKKLQIPEGDAFEPKTLINYSITRGYPILPHEIVNSFKILVSFGSIANITKNKTILKHSARIFRSNEILPIECLRVRNMQGKHLGRCIGVSLSDKPVILVSEQISREIASLFTDVKLEKDIMSDISQSVMGVLGVDLQDSLCPHNVLKTLISIRKIESLETYGKFLGKMAVNGIPLSQMQLVEKGTIYIRDPQITSF
ncbi:MAG: hypothetical protein GF308_08630 [Candidatus Heimdallarchaeota archaeon]|nr:hypothetical protein [Candidatus Heimdallarchaeota archaeon]